MHVLFLLIVSGTHTHYKNSDNLETSVKYKTDLSSDATEERKGKNTLSTWSKLLEPTLSLKTPKVLDKI